MSYIFENLLLSDLRKLVKSCPIGGEITENGWKVAKNYGRIFLTELNCFQDPKEWVEVVPQRRGK